MNHLQQVCRLMLLPVADGIATCKVTYQCGRCYCLGSYFNLSSEVLNRTSSHMCGRWNLPMFLLRDGLLTLMYSASLIALLRFWSSLPTILKFSLVTWWPVMLLWSYIGEGAFWCSFNLSPNGSWGFTNVFFMAVNPATLISIDDLTSFSGLDLDPWGSSGGFWWYVLL